MEPVTARPLGWLALIPLVFAIGCGGSGDGSIIGTGGRAGGSGGRGGESAAGGRGGGGATGGRGGSGVAGGKGGSSSVGGSVGAGGAAGASPGFGGHGGSSGTGGAATGCSITLQPVAPSSFDDIEAGPGVTLSVKALVSGTLATPVVWRWEVTSDALETIRTRPLDDTGSLVEFPIATPGNYRIIARIEGDSTCSGRPAIAHGVQPGPPALIFRITAAGFPVQDTRVKLSDGLSPMLTLGRGREFSIRPQPVGGQGNLLVSFVRVSSPATAFVLEGDTMRGPLGAVLFPYMTYDLLLVPDDPHIAPELLTAPPTDWPDQGITLDAGIPVGGVMLDSTDTPVAGARMILRRGVRPSTVGISDDAGQMSLRTRTGTLSAIIVPPAATGLPQASVSVAGGSGIAVPLSASSLLVTMRWNGLARGSLTVPVRGTDGAAVPGARVRLVSRDPQLKAGTLTIGGAGVADATLVASGSVDTEMVADAQGTATFGVVPVGDYDLTVVPPQGLAAAEAITGGIVEVQAARMEWTITLARKVTLTGTLAPLPAVAGAVVTAVDKSPGAVGTVASARVSSEGRYSLSVDPNRNYAIIIQPIGSAAARTVLRPVSVCERGIALEETRLPRGLAFSGKVVEDNGGWVGGSFIQVFCVATAPSCGDPTVALAEATTRGDGSFTMTLPDLTAVGISATVAAKCREP